MGPTGKYIRRMCEKLCNNNYIGLITHKQSKQNYQKWQKHNYEITAKFHLGRFFYVGTGWIYFVYCGTESFTRNIHGSDVIKHVTFPYSLNTPLSIYHSYTQIVSRHVFGAEWHLKTYYGVKILSCVKI